MTATDEIPFSRALAALAETLAYPLNSTQLHAYFVALSDRPLTQVLAACDAALHQCERFPSPAELRKLSKRRESELPFAGRDTTPPWLLLEQRTDSAYGKAVCALMRRALAERSGVKRAAMFRDFANAWNEHEPWVPADYDRTTLAKIPSTGDPWEHMAREAEQQDHPRPDRFPHIGFARRHGE